MLWGKEREPLLVNYASMFVDFPQQLAFSPGPAGKYMILILQMRKAEVHRDEVACP